MPTSRTTAGRVVTTLIALSVLVTVGFAFMMRSASASTAAIEVPPPSATATTSGFLDGATSSFTVGFLDGFLDGAATSKASTSRIASVDSGSVEATTLITAAATRAGVTVKNVHQTGKGVFKVKTEKLSSAQLDAFLAALRQTSGVASAASDG